MYSTQTLAPYIHHTGCLSRRLTQATPSNARDSDKSADLSVELYTPYIHTHGYRLTGFSRKQTPSDAGDAANQLTSNYNASKFDGANGNISLIDTTGIFTAFKNASWNEASETLTVYASTTVPAYQVNRPPVLLYTCMCVCVCGVSFIFHTKSTSWMRWFLKY